MHYNTIGINYNTTRHADPFIAGRILAHLAPKDEETFLDAGCGTGNYTIYLASKGLVFTGVDPSEKMLSEAIARTQEIKWINATAENIPSPANSFDGAIATLTIHHWQSLESSFVELSRLLKTNGRIVIFTSLPEQMKGYWLNFYFPKMMAKSMKNMPSLEQVQQASAKAGLKITLTEKYFVQKDLQDLFLYSGKMRPELYFDPSVRNGISSFAALANKEEVERGLNQLEQDIRKGTFKQISERYINNEGDYLFIVLAK